ncbi:hypothetical protein J6590_052592 [Homalodisca vitripennis]|nr:hypothetical protein J6590_052592 [Homalodisca vitripennis]
MNRPADVQANFDLLPYFDQNFWACDTRGRVDCGLRLRVGIWQLTATDRFPRRAASPYMAHLPSAVRRSLSRHRQLSVDDWEIRQ